MMSELDERIGVIYVHGIGEQRRFQHLDGEIRPLIDAIRRRPRDPAMSVEIVGGPASTLHADQDTWSMQPGAPVRAIVRENGRTTEICFHEVWWADVNEPYSFQKEYSFWLWGLSVWAVPDKRGSNLPGAQAVMRMPTFPGGLSWGQRLMARLKLLGVSNVFLMGAFSIGALTYLAKRLLDYSAPNVVRVFVNYVSSVKLYVQRTRVGGGFLDAYHEPPRVSVRRRMIRTLADVALQNYDRWYIFAHSLGSVVAYNGVMESAHALPNYLDEGRWRELVRRGFAGRARPPYRVGPVGDMVPARPLWLDNNDDVVYRDQLFGKLRGLLTYGSPLDKFAYLWPARVPINVGEPIFPSKAEWVNVYDPTDPVGASLDAFGAAGTLPANVIYPDNYGYRADWKLLYSHLCYLRVPEERPHVLSDDLAQWLLRDAPFDSIANKNHDPYFPPDSATDKSRTRWAQLMWLIVYVVLTAAGMFSLPFIITALKELAAKAIDILQQVLVWIAAHAPDIVARLFG